MQAAPSARAAGHLAGTYSQGADGGNRKLRKCLTLEWRFMFNGSPYILHFRITSSYTAAAIYLNNAQLLYKKYSFWEQVCTDCFMISPDQALSVVKSFGNSNRWLPAWDGCSHAQLVFES